MARYLVLNATCVRADSLAHTHAHHLGLLFVLFYARLDHLKGPLRLHTIVPVLYYASCIDLIPEERLGPELLGCLKRDLLDYGVGDAFLHLSLRLSHSFAVVHHRALLQLLFLNFDLLLFLIYLTVPLVESNHVLLPLQSLFLFEVFLFLLHFLQALSEASFSVGQHQRRSLFGVEESSDLLLFFLHVQRRNVLIWVVHRREGLRVVHVYILLVSRG